MIIPTGTVKWFSTDKGYGFISPDDGDKDVFVHFSGIVGEGRRFLEDGQRVSYTTEPSPKGERAIEVRPLEG